MNSVLNNLDNSKNNEHFIYTKTEILIDRMEEEDYLVEFDQNRRFMYKIYSKVDIYLTRHYWLYLTNENTVYRSKSVALKNTNKL